MTGPVRLLERDEELATLDEAVRAGAGHVGRLIAIQGQAGIGKSRLLEAARMRAGDAGFRVLFARGSSLERSFAYGVVRQLFEALLARSEVAEREEILRGPASLAVPVFEAYPQQPATGPSEDTALSILHGLFWLAANLAERQPLLLAVDDLHWCDTPSLEWLGYLARRLEGAPIVVVATLRPAEVEADPVLLDELTKDPLSTLLRPAPLSVAATAQMSEEILAASPEADFTAACLSASGGNPLLLVELLDALAAEGIAPEAAAVPRVHEIGPAAVSRSVRRRLAHLSPAAQAFARALAVLGEEADLGIVAELAEIDLGSAADAAHSLAGIEVITTGATFSFVHALVHDAVHLQLPPAQRREAHRRAARLLSEHQRPPEQAAAQLLLTPRAGDAWAVAILRAAARDALGRSAPAIAAVYLSRALHEPPAVEERGEVLAELGFAEAVTHDPEAETHLGEALSLSSDPPTRAEIALGLARLLFWRHATAEAIALLERTLAELNGEHVPMRARLEAELVGMAVSDPVAHAAVAERLSAVAEADDSVAGRMMLAFAAYRDALQGQARTRCIERAREAVRGGQLLAEEAWAAFIDVLLTLVWADELDHALRVAQEARALAQARGAPGSFAIASAAVVRVLHDRGRLFEAEAVAEAGLAACPAGQSVARPYAATAAAHVLLRRGDLAASETILTEGGLDSRHVPSSLHAANPLTVHGLLHLAQGELQAALEDFLAIRDLLEPAGCRNPAVARWRSGAALALLRLGKRDEARALAHEELELSRSWGAPTMLGRSLRAVGLVEGGQRGLELLEEAVGVLGHSPADYELLQTQVELAAALRRANHRARARELLRDCLDRAERSGAGLLARQAREELLATGARPRRVLLSGVASLTASERRIATMAAEGMTNREIAQALFVTTKTVEMHLAHVFSKLEIRSRTDLAEALGSAAAGTPAGSARPTALE